LSQNTGAFPPTGQNSAASPSTTGVAREEAASVGQSVREAGTNVAETATGQAKQVVSEARRQAGHLLGEVREQASAQQHKTAKGLYALADQLNDMAAGSGQPGMATQFAQEASHRIRGAASWLERREPDDLLEEVRDFARRRPGAFLLGAAAAGIVAGRMTRGVADGARPEHPTAPASAEEAATPEPPAVGGPDDTWPASPAVAGRGDSPYRPGQR